MSNPTELPDLDACPFCGNKAEMVDNGTGSWRVACLQSKGGCGATGRMTFDGGVTAAREWNRRAQPECEAPQAVAQVYLDMDSWMDVAISDLPTWERKGYTTRTLYPAATLSPLCGAQHAESGKEAAAAEKAEAYDELDRIAELHGFASAAAAIAAARRTAQQAPAPAPILEDCPEDDQQWAKVDPAVAFHLIERHAEDWADAGRLMLQWHNAMSRAAQLDGGQEGS